MLGLAHLPLVCLKIGLRDDGFMIEPRSRLVGVLQTLRKQLIRMIPALHYLALPTGEETLTAYDWWRIIRSNQSGVEPRVQQLSGDEGTDVKERLWNMDRESLLHFDIISFISHSAT